MLLLRKIARNEAATGKVARGKRSMICTARTTFPNGKASVPISTIREVARTKFFDDPLEKAPAVPEQWVQGSFALGSRELTYRLFVPSGNPKVPRPLVVMLHGCGQDAQDFAAGTRMNELARVAGVMVLYPEQTRHAGSAGCWNWFKSQHQQASRGEPAVLAGLVSNLATQHVADRSRMYVAGLSAGGAMASVVAHCFPRLFAAVGVHSGLPMGAADNLEAALRAMRHGCQDDVGKLPGSRLPLIVFHGDADDVVHPGNGRALVDAACRVQKLERSPVMRTGRSANCRSFTQRVFFSDNGVATVEHWQLAGAWHTWSGGSDTGSYTAPGGVDASAEMLRFFLSHRAPRSRGMRAQASHAEMAGRIN